MSDLNTCVVRACAVAALLAATATFAAAPTQCGKMPCALAERLSGFKNRQLDLRGVCGTWALQSDPHRPYSGERPRSRTPEASALAITLAPGVPRNHPVLKLRGLSDPYRRGPLLLQTSSVTADQIRALAQHLEIASIEPDCPLTASTIQHRSTSTGCEDVARWNAKAIGLDHLSRATAQTWVVVMDSGIHCRHRDLREAMSQPFPPDPDDGSPCPESKGSDFIEHDNMPNECDDNESTCFHGTRMAGIIGARGRHLVSGVNPTVGLRSVRILGRDNEFFDSTDTLARLAESIRVARDLGADVINMSWAVQYPAQLLEQAILEVGLPNASIPRGSLVVAASSNTLSGGAYPADFVGVANLVSVAGVRVEHDLSVWADTYQYTNADKFAAPLYARTTVPPNTAGCEEGESVAAAYVSGAASRIMAEPSLARCTPAEVKQILLCGAKDKPLANSDKNEHVSFLSLEFLQHERLRDQACASGHSWPACSRKLATKQGNHHAMQ